MTPRYQVPRIGDAPAVDPAIWAIVRAAELECSAERRPVSILIRDPWEERTHNAEPLERIAEILDTAHQELAADNAAAAARRPDGWHSCPAGAGLWCVHRDPIEGCDVTPMSYADMIAREELEHDPAAAIREHRIDLALVDEPRAGARDLGGQALAQMFDDMRHELARIAVALGRSIDGTGFDCDWHDLAGDIEQLTGRVPE